MELKYVLHDNFIIQTRFESTHTASSNLCLQTMYSRLNTSVYVDSFNTECVSVNLPIQLYSTYINLIFKRTIYMFNRTLVVHTYYSTTYKI